MGTATVSGQPPGLTWRLVDGGPQDIGVAADGERVSPAWAWGGSTGRGTRVCVVDSGVERDHPLVGPLAGSWVVVQDGTGLRVEETTGGDACGHGTACAGIIR